MDDDTNSEPPDLHTELALITRERDDLRHEVARLKEKFATMLRPQPIGRHEASTAGAESHDTRRSERISIDLPLTVPTAVRLTNAIAAYFPGAVVLANHDPQKIVIEFDQALLDEREHERR
jgi:hypothetical protein